MCIYIHIQICKYIYGEREREREREERGREMFNMKGVGVLNIRGR